MNLIININIGKYIYKIIHFEKISDILEEKTVRKIYFLLSLSEYFFLALIKFGK